jgi:type IV pilus assembly protein PilN
MRLNINLATEPYEDARRFWMVWGSLVGLLVLITIALAWITASATAGSRTVGRHIEQLRKEIAELDRERAAAEAVLNRPENRDTRDRSRFINGLIARKAFSWTQVFSDLEKIMPPRVRVVSIRPEVNAESQLELHLEAIGDSRDKAIDLVRRMEQSPTFRQARVRSEKDQPQGPNSGVQFEIVAQYVPHLPKEGATP